VDHENIADVYNKTFMNIKEMDCCCISEIAKVQW